MSCCLFAGIKTLLLSPPLHLLTNHPVVKWTNHFLHLRCTSCQVKHFRPAWLKWVNGFVSNFSFRFQMNVQRVKIPECTMFTHRSALRHLLRPSPFHLELPAPPKINCPYQVLASLTCLPPFQTCSRTLDVTFLLKTEYHFFNCIWLSGTAVLQLGAVDWKDVCLLALHGISRLVLQPLKQYGHNQIKCALADCKRNLT